MKILFFVLALFAMVYAEAPSSDYLPPVEAGAVDVGAIEAPVNEYVPPAADEPVPAHTLADDGYRYKKVRRVRYRHRV